MLDAHAYVMQVKLCKANTRGVTSCSSSFLLFFKFLTLAPHDYIIICQAQGLSGHTSPRGECAGFFLKDYTPIEED